VDIHPDVAARLGVLLEQLPRESTTTTTEVEHRIISLERYPTACKERCAFWVVKIRHVLRPNQLPQFQRRNRDAFY